MRKLTLLFDADDTLLDFDAAETASIKALLEEYGLPHDEGIVKSFKVINSGVWTDYENGKITRAEIGPLRFVKLFEKYNIIGVDPVQAGLDYWKHLAQTSNVIIGAVDMLNSINTKHSLYVITNGIDSVQEERFKRAHINQYFVKKYISGSIKLRKPDKEFFDYIERDIGYLDRENTYIIGDSISSDILGGINSDIKTIWYNPKFKTNTKNILPTYEVSNYQELLKLIEKLSED